LELLAYIGLQETKKLLRLLMLRVLLAPGAVLFQLHFLGLRFFIAGLAVVAPFPVGALKLNDVSHLKLLW